MSETLRMMLRPASSLIMIEKYKEYGGIVMPDNSRPGTGDLFMVKDVGPGLLNDKNERAPVDIKVGDIVAVLGKIFTVQFMGSDYHIARSEDVIAYCRR